MVTTLFLDGSFFKLVDRYDHVIYHLKTYMVSKNFSVETVPPRANRTCVGILLFKSPDIIWRLAPKGFRIRLVQFVETLVVLLLEHLDVPELGRQLLEEHGSHVRKIGRVQLGELETNVHVEALVDRPDPIVLADLTGADTKSLDQLRLDTRLGHQFAKDRTVMNDRP